MCTHFPVLSSLRYRSSHLSDRTETPPRFFTREGAEGVPWQTRST